MTGKKQISFVLTIAFLFTWSFSMKSENTVNIIPIPKKIEISGGETDISEFTILLCDDSRQGAIAAEEINNKIKELGGNPLPVINIKNSGPKKGKLIILGLPGNALLKEHGLELTENIPGRQGYIIEFKNNTILLGGSDRTGLMYAAVTFRYLLEKNEASKITALNCHVHDFPDFSLRYSTPHRDVKPFKGESILEANKKFIDWLFRHKINVFGNNITELPVELSAEIATYAKERGFKVFGTLPREKGKSIQSVARMGTVNPKNPRYADMVKHKGDYFTWSDDELLKEKAAYIAEYCKQRGIDLVLFHAVDGGGITDPELWSLRSKKCKERFGDDRASADAHVLSIFNNELKKYVPEMDILLVSYPYGPCYWNFTEMKRKYPELTKEIWLKNVINYQKQLAAKLPENIYVTYWLGSRDIMEEVMKAYKKEQPLCIYFEHINPAYQGYICPAVRFIKTNFFKGRPEMAWTAGNKTLVPVQELLDLQYYWNVNTEGSADFDKGIYSDSVSSEYYKIEETEYPPAIKDKLIPMICRNIWGEKRGSLLEKIFVNGLNPFLILKTSQVLARVNRVRRNAGLPNLEINASWMKKQFEAACVAAAAAEKLLAEGLKPDDTRWGARFIAHYCRESAMLKTLAGAKYYMLLTKEQRNSGHSSEALATASEALSFIEKSAKEEDLVIKKTAGWPDLNIKDEYYLQKNDVAFYTKYFTNFSRKLKEEKELTVKPREAGKVLKVAVFDASGDRGSTVGADEIKEILDSAEDINAEFVSDISLAELLNYDCLIFSQSILGMSSDKDDYFNSLRRFVEDGGRGIIFYHDACGYKRGEFGEKTVFPEICLKGEYGGWKNNKYILAGEHPVIKGFEKGKEFQHAYEDHILPLPGPDAEVIMKEKDSGKPVVIGGKCGTGRVIYDGTVFFSGKEKKEIPEFEKKRLVNSIKWLCGRKDPLEK